MRLHRFPLVTATLVLLLCFCIVGTPAQNVSVKSDREKALALVGENRHLDAYPLLDQISKSLPNDVEVWTHYGVAIAIRSATLTDPKIRKDERMRALRALTKAKELGSNDVRALTMFDQLFPDGGDDDNFRDGNPQVEQALREGEAFFGKGDYANAFKSYEKAYRLNPKSYEAAVFAGDTFYAQKKYRESEPWFEKAVTIDADREMAYRFWADALMGQGKTKDAQEKFIDAFLAEPYSRYSWESINKLTQAYGKRFDVKGIFPPGTDSFGPIVVDQTALTENDGSTLWLKFFDTKLAWRRTKFAQVFPGEEYRVSLRETIEALRAVSSAAIAAIKAGSLKKPHHSLLNLIELDESGFLESYVLLLVSEQGISEDYHDYRKQNRALVRKFISQRIFVLSK